MDQIVLPIDEFEETFPETHLRPLLDHREIEPGNGTARADSATRAWRSSACHRRDSQQEVARRFAVRGSWRLRRGWMYLVRRSRLPDYPGRWVPGRLRRWTGATDHSLHLISKPVKVRSVNAQMVGGELAFTPANLTTSLT